MSLPVIWTSEDKFDTLGHVSKLTLEGKVVTSPNYGTTMRDKLFFDRYDKDATPKNGVIIAGEFLTKTTFENVGHETSTTDSLLLRLKSKMIKDRINFVYPRIPAEYGVNGNAIQVTSVDELQASALVGVQLDADASIVIPPLPSGIQTVKVFNSVFERTKIEIQTFKKRKEIMGYIPKTENLELVRDMTKAYIDKDIKVFGVDFSGSSDCPAIMRTLLRTIREKLKIKKVVEDNPDKNYYIHVFNVTPNKKSINAITPITDLLTHIYGVDSTSGVMWGGGKLEQGKLRYYSTDDYGAYRLTSLRANHIHCSKELISNNPISTMERLRVDRITKYAAESQNIIDRIGAGDTAGGYSAYVKNKKWAEYEAKKILSHVKEIKAV